MASTLYSDPPVSRLSMSLESAATASPFPSPSSSFLTPPTPGAHEFAVKPVPSVRSGRKCSTTLSHNSTTNTPGASPRSSVGSSIISKSDSSQSKRSSFANGVQQSMSRTFNDDPMNHPSPTHLPSSPVFQHSNESLSNPTSHPPTSPGILLSETTTTPSSSMVTPTNHIRPLPPSTEPSQPTVPTEELVPIHVPMPLIDPSLSISNSLDVPASSPTASRPRPSLINRSSRPLSTASTASTSSHTSVNSSPSFDPILFSSRPAPPSPGGGSNPSLSRKPSTRSKPGSKPVSRANSLKNHLGSLYASSPNPSSPAPTLGGRGDGAATPHNRVSAGSQLSRSFSSSSLASPSKAYFDMGISASSPAIQDTTANSITTISSQGSSGSPSTTSTSTSISTSDAQLQPPPTQQDSEKVFVKIRDFAFQPTDERYSGQGPLVPKTNRVGRMNRRLGGRSYSTSSISSSDGDGVDDDGEGEGWGWNAGGYGTRGFGYGGGWSGTRFSWMMTSGAGAATAATIFDQEKAYATAAANLSAAASKANGNANDDADGYPSRSDMDRNFLDSESEEYYDAEDDGVYGDEEETFEDPLVGGEDDDEPLYPGLYRALYAFEPEGTAEMRLVEDQFVRVVGRGGGVGWAVVVAEPEEEMKDKDANGATKHALVPESYLEPYKLDWELDEGGATTNWRTA